MSPKRFWDIIAVACGGDVPIRDWHGRLVEQLVKLSPQEIVAFDRLFDEYTNAAYTTDLWAAAYYINGGASDDGFYYFRCWLVGRGRKVYEAALADPDSLADVEVKGPDAEASIYAVASRAWRAKGLAQEAFDAAREALGLLPHPDLAGEDWDFDDDEELRKRLPRLAAAILREDE